MKPQDPGGENATPLFIEILICILLLPFIILFAFIMLIKNTWIGRKDRKIL